MEKKPVGIELSVSKNNSFDHQYTTSNNELLKINTILQIEKN